MVSVAEPVLLDTVSITGIKDRRKVTCTTAFRKRPRRSLLDELDQPTSRSLAQILSIPVLLESVVIIIR